MRLLFLSILIIALVSNASAYIIDANGMGVSLEQEDGNGNSAMVHFYDTNKIFDPDDFLSFATLNPTCAEIGGDFSYSNGGTFGAEVSASSRQGDITNEAYTSAIINGQGYLHLGESASVVRPGVVTSVQESGIDSILGRGELHSGASIADSTGLISSANVVAQVNRISNPEVGFGYLSAYQGATTAVDGIHGVVASQSANAGSEGSIPGASSALVRAESSDTQGSTYTEAFVGNGQIGSDESQIYQLSAAGTVTGSGVQKSISELGIPLPYPSVLTFNGDNLGDHVFDLPDRASGSVAGGFYETAVISDQNFNSITELTPLLTGDYVRATAHTYHDYAGFGYGYSIEAYGGDLDDIPAELGAYSLAYQGNIYGDHGYGAYVPRGDFQPEYSGEGGLA